MTLYAFDGTWNLRDQKDAVLGVQPSQYGENAAFRRQTEETNVHRFREFLGAEHSEYLQGVGTRFSLLGRIVGGAFGIGGKWRIRRMYRRLCERYFSGDTSIDVVGFSRGAALAIHFANVIQARGIRDPKGPRHLASSYDPLFGWSWRMPKAPRSSQTPSPKVRFLGLWDTVASIGIPIRPFRNRPTRRWLVDTIPTNVCRSFHAMALDEVRATFALVRPLRAEDADRHYELWFRGVHSNVGGGYYDRGLSDISLAWMMEMYAWTLDKESERVELPDRFVQALQRLQPEPRTPDTAWIGTSLETLEPNPDGELGRPREIRRQAWRAMPSGSLVHHSAFRRTPNLLLDHYSANRRLLRPIPGDARPVYDPPFFYGQTPRQQAMAVAREAFYHVPVRAAEWLSINGLPVVRSDDWLAIGVRRRDLTDAKSRETFILVATEWLLYGRCAPDALRLPATFKDYDGIDIAALPTAQWVIAVLNALEPYVPVLRAYRSVTTISTTEKT
jgi:hypothetical protein